MCAGQLHFGCLSALYGVSSNKKGRSSLVNDIANRDVMLMCGLGCEMMDWDPQLEVYELLLYQFGSEENLVQL